MKIKKMWFEDEYIFFRTDTEHIIGNPLKWFPRLQQATSKQRENYEIYDEGIHWSELDEDLSLKGFFTYKVNLRSEDIYEKI